MARAPDLDGAAVPAGADVRHTPSSRGTAPRRDALSPGRAATVAGAAYLLTMATAVFAEFFVRGTLIVPGDAVRTASNVVANARLFRLGLVCDLVTWAGVVVLVWALHELLAPVHPSLALLAAFWRIVEASVLGAITVNGLVVLRLLSGDDYLWAVAPDVILEL